MRIMINAWRDLAHPHAGGSERLNDGVAAEMVRRGHDVTMFAAGPIGERSYPVVLTGGTYTHYLRTPIEHARHSPRPDVIVDTSSGMTYFSPMWSSRPVVLLTTHVHVEQWSMMFSPPVAALGRVLEARLAPRVYRHSLILVISPSTAAGYKELGYPEENFRPLPVFVDAPQSDAVRSTSPTFVAVGRLVPYKRFDLLLDIWREVREHVGGHLTIIGDGPERQRLEAMKPPDTTLAGFVSEEQKADLLASSWLLLHPASHEGWGIVITEAAAFGTPAIGFDTAGVRDSIRSDESGVLVDSAADFALAWRELAGDAERRNRLGQGARDYARDHDIESAGDAFEACLREAVARHGSG